MMTCQTRTRAVLLPNYKQYQFKQLIRKATRITNRSSTFLNHIATNKPNNIASLDSRTIRFSDHDLIFGMGKISGSMHKEPKIINCRNTKHYTPELFRKALTKAFWDHILNEDDPSIMSERLLDQFTEFLDQIATTMSRKVKNSYAPFIDKEPRHKMRLRDLHKKRHTRLYDSSNWLNYKQLRNEVTFELKAKRKSYFSQKLEESQGNIKETWKVLNTAMGRMSKTTVRNSLEVNSDTLTDHKAIAQELNNHFSTIADKISAEAEKNNEKTIGDKNASVHLSFIHKKQNPFKFQVITPHNIIRCISKMKNSKSGKIATKFVKDSIQITAPM